ncbi:nitrile hydratase accessory protein [Ramlibacter henchirensis]|uniref:Nitrile hydratase accessory protein n=1 Tax=Ramlibacter henchirensis TaxID=204072 RepID=A0A4Z0CAS8_9BURK|nr:nitrile hydratase accessory protein [Ramlibacter henchirensis]TFZ07179.1 nitrile hydratase accessory protein [Ramlibacter henchirensis]
MIDHDQKARRDAIPPVPGVPCDAEGPVFDAPWQAQAFAMAVALHERGLFTWPEWAQALGEQVRAAPAQPGESAGDAYYRQWLAALEHLVAGKGAATSKELVRYRIAWDHAADRTPHGQPIELQANDFPR